MFCNCHHTVGFLKGDEFVDYLSSHDRMRKKSSPWSLLDMFLNCLCRNPKQTAGIIFMQCMCPVMRELNYDSYGCVTELHGFCGR